MGHSSNFWLWFFWDPLMAINGQIWPKWWSRVKTTRHSKQCGFCIFQIKNWESWFSLHLYPRCILILVASWSSLHLGLEKHPRNTRKIFPKNTQEIPKKYPEKYLRNIPRNTREIFEKCPRHTREISENYPREISEKFLRNTPRNTYRNIRKIPLSNTREISWEILEKYLEKYQRNSPRNTHKIPQEIPDI